MQTDPLTYYAQPGPMTGIGDHADWLKGLPTTIAGVVEVVQGLLIHIFWAERYGVTLPEERQAEVQIRPAAEMLDRIRAVDDRSLTAPRPLDQKLVGNCRDFSVLTAALLRHQGIPVRVRCGFGMYFLPDHGEDHWICEVWDADEGRWVQFDAQLDAFQQNALEIDFNTLDMPAGQFLTGGQAWGRCQAGEADPDSFGIFDMHGLWFIRGNLVRDLASLNKMELLPWDSWGAIMFEGEEADSEENLALMDRVAALTGADNAHFAEVQKTYKDDARLRVPATITSWVNGQPQEVMIV